MRTNQWPGYNSAFTSSANVLTAANKARGMLYFIRWSFTCLTKEIFLSLSGISDRAPLIFTGKVCRLGKDSAQYITVRATPYERVRGRGCKAWVGSWNNFLGSPANFWTIFTGYVDAGWSKCWILASTYFWRRLLTYLLSICLFWFAWVKAKWANLHSYGRRLACRIRLDQKFGFNNNCGRLFG